MQVDVNAESGSMSLDQNVPEASAPQGPPPPPQSNAGFSSPTQGHGAGQSKSSRRRRRKRKNKTGTAEFSGGGEVAAGSEQAIRQEHGSDAASSAAPEGAVTLQASAAPQAPGPYRDNGAGGGPTKRWKKKFRDRNRPTENPGNQSSGGSHAASGGGSAPPFRGPGTHEFGNRTDSWKRKGGGGGGGGGKQGRDRGPRSFVGPMDHSYRAVNGNFAESSPSTIEVHNTFSGRSRSFHSNNDSQPIDYSQGRPVPIADDAPTRIYFFIDDLFFLAKIQETARKLGVKVAFVKNDKESLERLFTAEEMERPGLIVVDLNNANAKPMTLIPKLKSKLKRSASVIGFLSQVQGELRAKAVEAGCDTVMARSAFSQNLPNLLRRYGLEEEVEEGNFNY